MAELGQMIKKKAFCDFIIRIGLKILTLYLTTKWQFIKFLTEFMAY